MQNLLFELQILLKNDDRFVIEGELLKNSIIEYALKDDKKLIELLLTHEKFKFYFFTKIKNILIFKKDVFLRLVNNKDFLPDSYTSFKNKVGLTSDNEYISSGKDIVLAFPYKDCILEGGLTKEENKRNRPEIFWNEILAPDEVDRLLEPKVLTNFKKIDINGEHKITEIKSDDNLIIKGNNLLVLHSLAKKFGGTVKLIYIDPPYNIDTDSFNYNVRFNHSSWLLFMKNRLEIARDLLKNDGVIFIQIDNNEYGYLNVLMDEIFERDNFLQLISVKKATTAGFKSINLCPITVTEHILMYAKSKKDFKNKMLYVKTEYTEDYNQVILNKNENPKNWKIVSLNDIILKQTKFQNWDDAKKSWGDSWKNMRKSLKASYALENKETVIATKDLHKASDSIKILMEKSRKKRDRVFVLERSSESPIYFFNGRSIAFYGNKLRIINNELSPTEPLTNFWSDISWYGIGNEGGITLNNGKKPEKLLQRLIELTTEKNDLVLDFFVGSGTLLLLLIN